MLCGNNLRAQNTMTANGYCRRKGAIWWFVLQVDNGVKGGILLVDGVGVVEKVANAKGY